MTPARVFRAVTCRAVVVGACRADVREAALQGRSHLNRVGVVRDDDLIGLPSSV